MTSPVATLYGDGIAPERLGEIAARHGLVVSGDGAPTVGQQTESILLLDAVDHERLNRCVTAPYTAFIEVIGAADPLAGEMMATIKKSHLLFSLRTSTAYQMDSAALICEALTSRGILSVMKRSDVELSLHETISNAVVHGNLALASNMKGDAANFAKFAQELQSRMSSPDADKRVNIIATWDSEFLDISVVDNGQGYDESKLPANTDPFAPAGRGLAIIRSLTLAMNVTHGGRVTTLRFLT